MKNNYLSPEATVVLFDSEILTTEEEIGLDTPSITPQEYEED